MDQSPVDDDLDADDVDTADKHHHHMRYALLFAKAYASSLMHVDGLGWHRWSGTHWAAPAGGAEKRAVRKLVHRQLRALPKVKDEQKRKALFVEAQGIERITGVNGVLALAQAEPAIGATVDQLDVGPTLLNTPAGIVDLDTGAITPCEPAARMRKVTGASFDVEASSEVFETFLSKIMPDEEMRAFLARTLGASLFGGVRDQLLYIWHGAGANGKGTLRDAVVHAMGAYAAEVPVGILLQSRHGADSAPNMAARMSLLGTRMAFCSEVDKAARMDAATMKGLTGGDPVTGKYLYENPVTFAPTHQLFMLTNYLPEVPGDDAAVWRRLVAVPFAVNVPPAEWDKELSEKLRAPESAAAILAWIYRGWVDYQLVGLDMPEEVRKYTEQYQTESDVLGAFLALKTVTGPVGGGSGVHVQAKALFEAWQRYCTEEGPEPGTKTAFGKALRARGHVSEKVGGQMVYKGLGLAVEDTEAIAARWAGKAG